MTEPVLAGSDVPAGAAPMIHLRRLSDMRWRSVSFDHVMEIGGLRWG